MERNAEVSLRNFILNHQRHFSFSQFIMDIIINFHKKSPLLAGAPNCLGDVVRSVGVIAFEEQPLLRLLAKDVSFKFQ